MVSPVRKHPRPNGQLEGNQVKNQQLMKIKVVKSTFQIALVLVKAYSHLDNKQQTNKDG